MSAWASACYYLLGSRANDVLSVDSRSVTALHALREDAGWRTSLRQYARAFGHTTEQVGDVESDVKRLWRDACDNVAESNTPRVTDAVFAMMNRMSPAVNDHTSKSALLIDFKREVSVALDRAFSAVEDTTAGAGNIMKNVSRRLTRRAGGGRCGSAVRALRSRLRLLLLRLASCFCRCGWARDFSPSR